MRIALDTSTLISLAWAGQLELLGRAPIELVVPDEVRQEAVLDGLARGYADAAAIEQAIKTIPSSAARPAAEAAASMAEMQPVDHAVLEAGRVHGALLTNDLALGRRAANLGVRWLRTADLVVLCVKTKQVSNDRGVAALKALHSAGRITEALLTAYLEDLS